jgi:hypothetical protein
VTIKSMVFRTVTSCSSSIARRFGETYYLHLQGLREIQETINSRWQVWLVSFLPYPLTLKMEVLCSSEMSDCLQLHDVTTQKTAARTSTPTQVLRHPQGHSHQRKFDCWLSLQRSGRTTLDKPSGALKGTCPNQFYCGAITSRNWTFR